MAVSSRSPDLPPTASTSLPFSPSLSSPATNAFAATSLVRSHGSAPTAMDEFCLQRVVGTDHRAALEGSGRGSPPLLRLEEAIDAPYFTPSQQQRAPPRPFVGTPCSAYFVDDVLQAVLPGKKMHITGNLRVEKKNPIQAGALAEDLVGADVVGCGRRRWPTLAGRRWRNSGLAAPTSHCNVRLNGDIEERHRD
ncbi:uncharacterized protein LOC125525231 [Triticum urartu]|uniref:uncharacterized protein LOC125525231 n=1 Tax=Triticum urartu TaxID=4572 RepID=UPI0020432880|nr:uncharacterized protein LOC125525231 [Triticum urartu]